MRANSFGPTICPQSGVATANWQRGFVAALFAALAMVSPSAQSDIASTVHNLTPGGKGAFKEGRPVGLCVFCHTPHNSTPKTALWNRDLPAITYQLYESSTLRSVLNQPNGSSRLCLSCHDGILAMGNLRQPPKGDKLKLGKLTGANVVGTDLSHDHPVSFVYDSALAIQRPGLVDPGSLPAYIRLDGSKQLQCTSCHDAHTDKQPHFLRTSNLYGGLCLACHRLTKWSGSTHSTSPSTWHGSGANPWPADAAASVAANACDNCHRSHAAGHGQWLMAQADEPSNCEVCHGGTVAVKNIAAEFANGAKYSRHPIDSTQWTHDPREVPASMPRHVACSDCHNPHASNSAPALPPLVSGRLRAVSGVTLSGSRIGESIYEYQVCNKCHGATEPNTIGPVRVESTRIVSTKIDTNNMSFHPIAGPGRNATIRGLLPGYTSSSIIGCTDCHNNNDWAQSGNAPKGPHASRYAPILERNYISLDPTVESMYNYDMCYKCHDRNTLLRNQTGTFPHLDHVVNQQTPCAVCHDAHGVRQNSHLINFMLRDSTGKKVVTANHLGRLQYVPSIPGKGSCYLTCHGTEHNPLSY
jgi:predicted CXXCH cytochrome family protein